MPTPEDRNPNALPHATKLQGGAFSIGKIVGQGGFGITYIGSDSRLHRVVAVKEFFPSGCIRQGKIVQPGDAMETDYFNVGKKQFLEEARALARFKHPNIVQILTVFEENNTAYLVMEFLKGQTLESLVAQSGALPEDQAIGYINQLSEALIIIHAEEIIHRDIIAVPIIMSRSLFTPPIRQ